uniref:RNase H type-1 domain-containing protein n=1 Tax=Chenopodium quinoa TaxID=63459 RepID=A0A803MR11_CHEQI
MGLGLAWELQVLVVLFVSIKGSGRLVTQIVSIPFASVFVELLAIKEGLAACWARGIRYLELKTDAQALKYMLENPLQAFKEGLECHHPSRQAPS